MHVVKLREIFGRAMRAPTIFDKFAVNKRRERIVCVPKPTVCAKLLERIQCVPYETKKADNFCV